MGTPASQLWIIFDLVIFSVLFFLIGCAPTADYRIDDWKPFTWKPIDWKRFTSSPDDYNGYKSSSKRNIGVFFLIVIPGIVVYILIHICQHYCKKSSSSTDLSCNTTLHAAPRKSTNATRSGTESAGVHRPPSSIRREGSQIFFINEMTDFPSNSNRSNFGQNSSNIPINDSTMLTCDRPPDYVHVVHSDLSEPITKFPVVNPKRPETPPPNYDEMNLPKIL